jgi:hypothetical protein
MSLSAAVHIFLCVFADARQHAKMGKSSLERTEWERITERMARGTVK